MKTSYLAIVLSFTASMGANAFAACQPVTTHLSTLSATEYIQLVAKDDRDYVAGLSYPDNLRVYLKDPQCIVKAIQSFDPTKYQVRTVETSISSSTCSEFSIGSGASLRVHLVVAVRQMSSTSDEFVTCVVTKIETYDTSKE